MKIRMTNFLRAVSLFAVAAPAFAGFEIGLDYYQSGNYEKAYEEFLESARYGHSHAQRNIGAMYYRGEHVEKDPYASYAWFAVSAEGTSAGDDKLLHEKLYSAFDSKQKLLADEQYRQVLAEYGAEAVKERLMPTYSAGSEQVQALRPLRKLTPEYPRALERQGRVGFVDVIYSVGKDGVTRDHTVYFASDEGFKKPALAALRGWIYEPELVNGRPVDVYGVKMRFKFHMSGTRTHKLEAQASVLREKALKGDDGDKLHYALMLDILPTYVDDYASYGNPNEWYERAASEGNGAAGFFLGRNILYGNRCDADSTKSMGWLLKAASANISEAQYMLGIELMSGARFERDLDKAFFWLKRAAGGSIPAQLRYAWILATSSDTKFRDGEQARVYVGQIPADYPDKQTLYQVSAAVAAENGEFEEAVRWQQRALDDARELELPEEDLLARLETYREEQPWREAL